MHEDAEVSDDSEEVARQTRKTKDDELIMYTVIRHGVLSRCCLTMMHTNRPHHVALNFHCFETDLRERKKCEI
jgi:hypothetical protein